MTDPSEPGRRERKKAATRKAISDTATLMFIERGFDDVTIKEIAEAADVSPATVYLHFPQKEALVFDEDDAQRERLVAAVRDRTPGTSVSAALKAYLVGDYEETVALAGEHPKQQIAMFMDLVRRTPALAEYEARMWLRHEDALAAAIAGELGQAAPSLEVRAFARFVLQIWQLMNDSDDPIPMLEAAFRILDPGWSAVERAGRLAPTMAP